MKQRARGIYWLSDLAFNVFSGVDIHVHCRDHAQDVDHLTTS